MKRFSFCTLGFGLLTLLAVIPVANSAESYLLKNIFVLDDTYYLTMRNHNMGVTKTGSMDIPIDVSMDIVMSFKTVEIDNDGAATIQIGIPKMTMINQGEEQNLRSLLGIRNSTRLLLTINSSGKVLKEPTLPGAKSNMANVGRSPAEQNPWLTFPEEPVEIGARWNADRVIPMTGASKELILSSTYTLKDVIEEEGEKIAVIETETYLDESDISFEPNTTSQKLGAVSLDFVFKKYATAGKGDIRFAIDKGHISFPS